MCAPFSFNDSFPSGHTTVAFAWATVFAENYGIWYITYPVAVMCGAARIYKNMHWASDVFVGAMIGTFFGKIICQDNNFNIGMSAGLNDNASIIIIKMSI
jgi:membrane-associated phospholipid phosphatase